MPRLEGGPRSSHGTSAPSALLPPIHPHSEGLPARWLGSLGPRKCSGGSGLFRQRATHPRLEDSGGSSLEGFGADVWLHFPPGHLFSWCRKKPLFLLPPAPTPTPPLLSDRADGVTREALGRGARGGGAAWEEQPPSQVDAAAAGSAVGPLPGLARRLGRERGHPGAVRLAAPRRRSCRPLTRGVCAWMGGPPRPCRETSPAPTGPSSCGPCHWQPKFSGRKCNGFLF